MRKRPSDCPTSAAALNARRAAAVDASTIDAAAIGREAAGKARATADAVSVEPGDYPVVLEEYAVVTGMTLDGTFLVENGTIVGPVKNPRYTQSYLAALAGTVAVARERRTLKGFLGGRGRPGRPHRRLDLYRRHRTLMTGGEAIWVCANCRSVNKLRAKQCYNCRTPKDRAAVDPMSEHVGSRSVSLPEFQPSRPFAVVASALILVIGGLQAINSLVGAIFVLRLVEGDIPSEGDTVNVGVLGLATIGVGLIALTGWAAWLSKVVRVMPALGLGYPAANGLMAFVENFIPVLNLWRVPAIVRDVVVRLEPSESKGGALIFVAWIGLIAGYLLPRFGALVNRVGSEPGEDYVRNQIVVQSVAAGLVLVGSVFLVALIWWIEGRISQRRAAGSATESAAASRTVPSAAAPSVAWASAPATASAHAPTRTVPGPLGSMVVAAEPDPVVSRPITAVTGETTPLQATPITAATQPTAQTEPAVAQPHEPESEPEAAADLSAGPRLRLAIAYDGSMVASLEGESEHVTPEELREAAAALARVEGSAIVAFDDGTVAASTSMSKALRILADAGVPTAVEPG